MTTPTRKGKPEGTGEKDKHVDDGGNGDNVDDDDELKNQLKKSNG